MRKTARKIAFVVFWYGLYLNTVLYLLIPQIYAQAEYRLLLLAIIGIGALDTAIRPLSERGSARDRYSLLMFVLFLLNPFLFCEHHAASANVRNRTLLQEVYVPL